MLSPSSGPQPILDKEDLVFPEGYWDDVHWPYPRLMETYKTIAGLTDEQALIVIKINALVCHGCWSQPAGCFCRSDE